MNITNINNKAYFMLPGFCEHFNLYILINEFLKKHPDAKRENAEIYCYYGNVPFCTWDGGRIFNSYSPLTKEKIKNIQHYYNEILQSKIRLVYTNSLLKEEHCLEHYNNLSLNIFHNCNNEIVINSEILENYIKNNYPNYDFISSTTKCLSSSNESKKELNKNNYKFICLDYNLNHNWKFLDTLTQEEKLKTEFLINPICGIGCDQRKEHYRLNSLFALSYGKSYNLKNCEIKFSSLYPKKHLGIISADEIYNIYLPKGFQYYKIEGRTFSSIEMAIYFAEYLIKPEFQNFFLENIYIQLKERE